MFADMIADSDPAIATPMITPPGARQVAPQVAALPPSDLAKISCPVLLLAGDPPLGGAQSPADVAEFLTLVPTAEADQISNVGHQIRTTPHTFDTYLEKLRRFADTLKASRS